MKQTGDENTQTYQLEVFTLIYVLTNIFHTENSLQSSQSFAVKCQMLMNKSKSVVFFYPHYTKFALIFRNL